MKSKRARIITIVMCCFFFFAAAAAVTFFIIRETGRKHLLEAWEDVVPELPEAESAAVEEQERWEAGWVRYKDDIYSYNKDIMTFLLMGIDKPEMKEVAEGTQGGQADALFLLVLNPRDRSIQIISVNRNSMTDVKIYDEDGQLTRTVQAQVAVQHGFGNGVEESCEYQVEAVRKLFYNVPVHGYCAINMNAVVTLTDLLGGIELTALEDVPFRESGNAAKEGEQILLTGSDAYYYLQHRDVTVDGSANTRLLRQQQFLDLFVKKVKTAFKEDIQLPVKFYEAIAEQMITDVELDEVVYLATQAGDYDFGARQLHSMKGETVQGEEFEEFYADEDALFQLIIDVFYEPVDMDEMEE